jgi:Macro domain
LEEAVKNGLRSICFCCISTGIYGYPNVNAAKVALSTVRRWLETDNNADSLDSIVFCTFLDVDKSIYEQLMTAFFPRPVAVVTVEPPDADNEAAAAASSSSATALEPAVDGSSTVSPDANREPSPAKGGGTHSDDNDGGKSGESLHVESIGTLTHDHLAAHDVAEKGAETETETETGTETETLVDDSSSQGTIATVVNEEVSFLVDRILDHIVEDREESVVAAEQQSGGCSKGGDEEMSVEGQEGQERPSTPKRKIEGGNEEPPSSR